MLSRRGQKFVLISVSYTCELCDTAVTNDHDHCLTGDGSHHLDGCVPLAHIKDLGLSPGCGHCVLLLVLIYIIN